MSRGLWTGSKVRSSLLIRGHTSVWIFDGLLSIGIVFLSGGFLPSKDGPAAVVIVALCLLAESELLHGCWLLYNTLVSWNDLNRSSRVRRDIALFKLERYERMKKETQACSILRDKREGVLGVFRDGGTPWLSGEECSLAVSGTMEKLHIS